MPRENKVASSGVRFIFLFFMISTIIEVVAPKFFEKS